MKPNEEQKRKILDNYYDAVVELTGLCEGDEGYAEAFAKYNKCADEYLSAINGTWQPSEEPKNAGPKGTQPGEF